MQLSIIIVNYNVRALLAQCLSSIEQAGKGIEYEIIVVDNKSADDSEVYFSDNKTVAKFIWNNENLGFAKANNLGLSIAKGRYTLFLNPDTLITPESLTKCLAHIKNTERCGAVGVHMIDGTGNYLPESKRNVPTILSSFFYFSGIAKQLGKSSFFNSYHAGGISRNERRQVPILSGAFMMADTALIKSVGGFDPRYFMYAEDVDLSLTLEKLGYNNWYLGDVKILHYKGESSKIKNAGYYKVFFSAMKLFAEKHSGAISGKIKQILIGLTQKVVEVKLNGSAPTPRLEEERENLLATAYCTADEKEKINLLNEKFGLAKKIEFVNVFPGAHPARGVAIYSSSVINYTQIIKNISPKRGVYIFNSDQGTLIGSNGQANPANVYYL